jgi:chromosome segregation ATPase
MSVGDDLDYQETIALLEEEIVRLESELRSRNEEVMGASGGPGPHDEAAEEEARRKVSSLTAELGARDETIGLLEEQLRLLEEITTADRQSWEQLNQWVQELEERVDGQGDSEDLRKQLEAEHRKAAAASEARASEQRIWEARRQELEADAEQLRATLAQAARKSSSADVTVIAALEKENRKLRAANSQMAKIATTAAEAEGLRERLQSAIDEVSTLKQALQQAHDDRHRERNEFQAVIADLKSQMAHESLKRQDDQVNADAASANGAPSPTSADERIRALRQHLQQIHEHEEQVRANKRLSARLSRLWHHTGPRR